MTTAPAPKGGAAAPQAEKPETKPEAEVTSTSPSPDEVLDAQDEFLAPEGFPCVVLKTFFDSRSALIEPGTTYYYVPKKGEVFPIELLEPVNKVIAHKMREAYEDFDDERNERAEQRKRAEAALSEILGRR